MGADDYPPEETGLWFGDNTDVLVEFDEFVHDLGPGGPKRNSEIQNAMELYVVVRRLLIDADADPGNQRELRTLVRQALLDYLEE